MSEAINAVYQAVDEEHAGESAATRRKFVAGAAATLGSLGLLGVAERASAQDNTPGRTMSPNTVETIGAVAATAEVLATIVNTVGLEKVPLDAVTKQNVEAAAREELIHYQVLVSDAVGAKPVTKRIWVPDAVFSSRQNFLETLVVGDQVFINAYLLGLTVFARGGGLRGSRFARYLAEFMGAEAVHRALALQSLGRPGNDRAFMKFAQREAVQGIATTGQPGFYKITEAVTILEGAGFGFGKEGAGPGQFYDFDEVSKRTPDPQFVNTRTPN